MRFSEAVARSLPTRWLPRGDEVREEDFPFEDEHFGEQDHSLQLEQARARQQLLHSQYRRQQAERSDSMQWHKRLQKIRRQSL